MNTESVEAIISNLGQQLIICRKYFVDIFKNVINLSITIRKEYAYNIYFLLYNIINSNVVAHLFLFLQFLLSC